MYFPNVLPIFLPNAIIITKYPKWVGGGKMHTLLRLKVVTPKSMPAFILPFVKLKSVTIRHNITISKSHHFLSFFFNLLLSFFSSISNILVIVTLTNLVYHRGAHCPPPLCNLTCLFTICSVMKKDH